MATPAEHLRGDDLFTRYVQASRRSLSRRLDTDDLTLARYLRALGRRGMDGQPEAMRTCPSCGREVHFDAMAGGWAECSMCGSLA